MRDDAQRGHPAAPGTVTATRSGHVATITYANAARRNAVSLAMLEQAEALFRQLADDDDIRVVIVTGAGDTFVSGADISRFEDERATRAAIDRYNETNYRVFGFIHDFPKPTIAMIRGHCVGGGLTLAVACDLRFCADDAKFSLPAAKLGLGYGFQPLKWFIDLLGPATTRDIFFSARRLDAAEALRIGLVDRCVPVADLDTATLGYAAGVAENAPVTVSALKQVSNEILKGPGADLDLCERLVQRCWDSGDYVEGRRAFMEKRKPEFKGR
jgi:enoyl-CoA hydratase